MNKDSTSDLSAEMYQTLRDINFDDYINICNGAMACTVLTIKTSLYLLDAS